MSRRILTFMCLTAAVLGLTACGNNSHTDNKNGSASSTQKQAPKKLIAKDLSASEKASAITIYGAQKYKKAWQKTYQTAEKNGLSVAVKSPTAFRYIKDKGYIYQVSGNGKEPDTYYILEGNTVNFYNRKKLGSASLNKIVSYLNGKNEIKNVRKLTAYTTMGASITSDKYGVKGDNGLATIPKKLQGTWYNRRGKKLVIDAHSINGEEIHKVTGSLAPTSFDQTKKWARARMENINGIDCYHVQALNAQNFGRLYTVQKKGKNKAVATYSVDTGSCTGSYWKSVKLAKANVDTKFASLS